MQEDHTELSRYLEDRLPDGLRLLKQMVGINSFTNNRSGVNKLGKITAKADTVTLIRDVARVAPPAKDIDLQGKLTSVNLKDSVAELSIGSADGVEEGMRFHATREDKYICDIVVMDVEPEKALGTLELVQDKPQDKPKAGDAISTNL